MISRRKFLEAVFRDLKAAEAVALGTTREHEGHIVYPVRPWTHGASVWSRATHFSVGALFKDQGRGFKRRKGYFSGAFCLVLDDIHEKAAPPQIKPSWKMLTKPGSEQWGYLFSEPMRDEQAYNALVASFIDAGHSDPGGASCVRLVRLPGSKPLGKQHAAELIEFDPARRMKPVVELILKTFGLKRAQVVRNAVATSGEGLGGDDPVLDWLAARGLVLGRETNGWTPILCPWVDEHTPGPGRDTGTAYRQVGHDGHRAFHCFHKCNGLGRDTEAFFEWVAAQGGPDIDAKDERLIEAKRAENAKLREGAKPWDPDPVVLRRFEQLAVARTKADQEAVLNSLVWTLLAQGWQPEGVGDLILNACPQMDSERLRAWIGANAPRMIGKQDKVKMRLRRRLFGVLDRKPPGLSHDEETELMRRLG